MDNERRDAKRSQVHGPSQFFRKQIKNQKVSIIGDNNKADN